MTAAQQQLFPTARLSDPATSHNAAETVAPANDDLVLAIRQCVRKYGALTAFEIADIIGTSRWQADTVRTACARAGLEKLPGGVSPGGRPCVRYGFEYGTPARDVRVDRTVL